jgi:hypothetical protein
MNALPRVLELESAETIMVEALLKIRAESNDLDTFRIVENALRLVGSSYLVDLAAISRVLGRICAVLEPTAGKGHALETIKEDHQRTVGSQQSITYACIMPGCEVCAVVGAAQEMLKVLTEPPLD